VLQDYITSNFITSQNLDYKMLTMAWDRNTTVCMFISNSHRK